MSPSPFLGPERSEFKATACIFIITQQAHLIHSCPVFSLHRSRWWGQVRCGWCWLPLGLLLPLFLSQAHGQPLQPPLKLDAAVRPSLYLEDMSVNNQAAPAFLLLRRLPSCHFLSFPRRQGPYTGDPTRWLAPGSPKPFCLCMEDSTVKTRHCEGWLRFRSARWQALSRSWHQHGDQGRRGRPGWRSHMRHTCRLPETSHRFGIWVSQGPGRGPSGFSGITHFTGYIISW